MAKLNVNKNDVLEVANVLSSKYKICNKYGSHIKLDYSSRFYIATTVQVKKSFMLFSWKSLVDVIIAEFTVKSDRSYDSSSNGVVRVDVYGSNFISILNTDLSNMFSGIDDIAFNIFPTSNFPKDIKNLEDYIIDYKLVGQK